MVCLGVIGNGRDNNFNLIRLIAATSVLVSHAWPITRGPGTPEPLAALTGHSLGGLAVYIFFATSGYFITASFARSNAASIFLGARALRLFPGLAVSLVLVILMGLFVTTLPAADYLTDPQTHMFFLRNITLAFPQYSLPDVFTENPYPAVEGSIWTLIHEVLCYGLVFLLGMIGIVRNRRAMTAALFCYLALWILPELMQLSIHPRLMQTRELSLPFALGIALWVWRDHVQLSAIGMIALAAIAALAKDSVLGFPTLILAITYATFWCAYVPNGRIRAFNRLGDYSYGMYIYAFPIQGLVVWLAGPLSPQMNILLALPLTVFCAVLSWHLVEGPALSFGKRKLAPRPAATPQPAH
jgi:peptidoglycan/LPS O-acetylase OafA/YrhL